MTIKEFAPGEGISRTRLNEIVQQLNKLEDANRFNGILKNFGGSTYTSTDYNIQVQGVTATLTDKTPDYIVGRVDYPKPFSQRPAVVVTLNSTGAYKMVPYIMASTGASCEVRVSKVDSTFAIPDTISINVIAIGPV